VGKGIIKRARAAVWLRAIAQPCSAKCKTQPLPRCKGQGMGMTDDDKVHTRNSMCALSSDMEDSIACDSE
jgi:hypothetical protein